MAKKNPPLISSPHDGENFQWLFFLVACLCLAPAPGLGTYGKSWAWSPRAITVSGLDGGVSLLPLSANGSHSSCVLHKLVFESTTEQKEVLWCLKWKRHFSILLPREEEKKKVFLHLWQFMSPTIWTNEFLLNTLYVTKASFLSEAPGTKATKLSIFTGSVFLGASHFIILSVSIKIKKSASTSLLRRWKWLESLAANSEDLFLPRLADWSYLLPKEEKEDFLEMR